MKRQITIAVTLLALITNEVFAQGSLTPLGGPAPTMMTLDEIGAAVDQLRSRMPISQPNLTITVAGSYYLTTNLVPVATGQGIRISADNVAGNTVKDNVDNYNIAAGNQLNIMLCDIPETLEWPCSVKLAGTLICMQNDIDGITVAANDVTIDMAGHTLVGPGASSGNGIYQDAAYRNLRLFNGKVVHWKGDNKSGIYSFGQTSVLSDLQSTSNVWGFILGYSSVMRDCTAQNNVNYGIYAIDDNTIHNCTASSSGSIGIHIGNGCTLSGCTAKGNETYGIRAGECCSINMCVAESNTGSGIHAGDCCSINKCLARSNTSYGINVGPGSTIHDSAAHNNTGNGFQVSAGSAIAGCAAHNNLGNGIRAYDNGRITGCACDRNGYLSSDGAGIYVTGHDNRIDSNNITGSDRGIDVDGTGNIIIRNTASGNSINYEIVADNKVGEIVSAPNSGAISGNTGGAGVGSTNPWANFSF